MRDAAGPAAGENETYLGAAGYPGEDGLFFLFDRLGQAGRDEEQEKKDDSMNTIAGRRRFAIMSDSLGSS